MFNVSEKTIFYIVCPYFFKTGGTELAHQLVAELNKNGVKAIITYYGDGEKSINPAFKKYVDEYIDISNVKDLAENIIVLPEIAQTYVDTFNNIQKAVWWMSVDNFVKRNGIINAMKFYGLAKSFKYVLTKNIPLVSKKISNRCIHFYQSEYAKNYLEEQGISNLYPLSDFINDSFFEKSNYDFNREDIVLYNPKKGFDFTKTIIDGASELRFIPLENMTNQQVINLLRSSKVYIDFGNHPGKDRFPREAAISGCCIITNKKGSAKYFDDVPIPEEYKFEDTAENIDKIIDKIKLCISNYDEVITDFKDYREKIESEHKIFIDNVKELVKNE